MARPAKSDGAKSGKARTDSAEKSRRYCESQKAKGLRLLRIWVPDTRAPGFAEEARRQAALLRGAPEEAETLDFIEKVADWGNEQE